MDHPRQEKAVDALRDWSKWLISLDFAAATGCVIVLQRDITSSVFLVLAVASFAVSVVCSILVVRALASLVEILPLRNVAGEITTIYEYRIWHDLTLSRLVVCQMSLFFLGVTFFLLWVF